MSTKPGEQSDVSPCRAFRFSQVHRLFQRRHPAKAGDAERFQHAPRLPLHHGQLLDHPRHRRLLHHEVGGIYASVGKATAFVGITCFFSKRLSPKYTG